MSFLPVKSDHGGVPPFEYLPAAADTYQVGQLLNMTDGRLAAIAEDQTTTPPYVCMAQRTAAADELLPVARVSADYIYETVLGAAAADAKAGGRLQVAAGGMETKAGEGTFEIVDLEGTAKGSLVLGRWTAPENSAAPAEKA